jgi:hypothetical protein
MPTWTERAIVDEDSDVAYYLCRFCVRHGDPVTRGLLTRLEEPLRSKVEHWTRLDVLNHDCSQDSLMVIDGELGVVVTWGCDQAYGVHWISSEGLEVARRRVRQMKVDGTWKDPHPGGVMAVFGRG